MARSSSSSVNVYVSGMESWLRKYRVDAHVPFTHILGTKKYNIPVDKLREFYDLDVFHHVTTDTVPFVNFNERNGTPEDLLRYVLDLDAENVSDDTVRAVMKYVGNEVKRRRGGEGRGIEVYATCLRPGGTNAPSKVHMHFINLVVDRETYEQLNVALASVFPDAKVDVRAGMSMFMVYGSGKLFRHGKQRLLPYLPVWSGVFYDGNSLRDADRHPTPYEMCLRRPLCPEDILVSADARSPPTRVGPTPIITLDLAGLRGGRVHDSRRGRVDAARRNV